MTDNDAVSSTYSRREFIAASGKGIVGAAIASMLVANTTGCNSKAAAYDSGMWETVRHNDFTLNDGYIYVNNSTLGTTLRAVQERMAEVNRIFTQGCYLDRFVGEIIRALPPILVVPGGSHGQGAALTEVNWFNAITNWVEMNIAPEQLVYNRRDEMTEIVRTLPVCQHPRYPRYNGAGDVNSAASYTCTIP